MTAPLLFLLLAMLPAQPTPAPATPAPPDTPVPTQPDDDPALIRRLEAIDAHAAGITDLTASFEQRRHTPLLRKPVVSSGRVRVKGSTVRWDTDAPRASVVLLDSASLRIYYPEQRTLEVYPIAAGLDRLAATPLPRLKSIREQFTIRACNVSELDGVAPETAKSAVALLLLPKGDELKKHVRKVRVLLDEPPASAAPDGDKSEKKDNRDGKHPYGVARQVEVTDADGDRTIVVFKDIKTSIGLKDRDLELAVPEGTRVSHPLEGGPPRDTERKDRK